MLELSREMIAYGIIAICLFGGGIAAWRISHARRRQALRRRGIKIYGH